MRYSTKTRYFDPAGSLQGELGYQKPFECHECRTRFEAPGYTMTARADIHGPEEGECYCPSCGSSDYGETDSPIRFAAHRRRATTHPLRSAA